MGYERPGMPRLQDIPGWSKISSEDKAKSWARSELMAQRNRATKRAQRNKEDLALVVFWVLLILVTKWVNGNG